VRSQRPGGLDGAGLAGEPFVLRYVDADHGDRLVLVNLGRELTVDPAPEPLWLSGLVAVLSPPPGDHGVEGTPAVKTKTSPRRC
jgi:hypothetical protein